MSVSDRSSPLSFEIRGDFGEEAFCSARRANCPGMGVGAPIEIYFMAFRRFGHVFLDLGHTLLDAKHKERDVPVEDTTTCGPCDTFG